MKRVIVRLGNGLGNQLFTYAAAYTFAKKNNVKLFIDDESGFYKRYKYELDNFNITTAIAEKEDKFLGHLGRLRRKFLKRIKNINKNRIFLIEELDNNKFTNYNPSQLNINFDKIVHFEGYFQTEKYFKLYEKELINELTFKKQITGQDNKYKKQIIDTNSVSLHLRQDKFDLNDGFADYKKLSLDFLKIL